MKLNRQFWIKKFENKLENVRHLFAEMRLRHRLIVYAIIVLIPLIIFSLLTLWQRVENTKRQILNSNLSMAKVVAANLDEKIHNTDVFLQSIALSPTTQSQDIQATKDLLISLFPTNNDLVNLSVADKEGSVYATIVWHGSEPRNISDSPYFDQVRSSGNRIISESITSRATDQRVIRMFIPTKANTGEVSGVLLADLSLSQLQRNMFSIGIEEGASIIVTDRKGTVLVYPNYKFVYDEINLSEWPSVIKGLAGEEGTIEHLNQFDKKPWLWGYSPVQSTGWTVLVGYPSEAAVPPMNDILIRGGLFLLGMLGIAIIISIYLSERLASPLRELTKQAMNLSDGNFPQEMILLKGSREVRQLSSAFAVMSTKLSEHVKKLALAKEKNQQEAIRLHYLLDRTVSLQEEERKRIATDLHDSTSQMILGSLYETEAAIELVSTNSDLAVEKLVKVENLLQKTSEEMRRVIYDLRPPLLDDMGLGIALENYIKNYAELSNIKVEYWISDYEKRYSSDIEMTFYRIAQEAFTNIYKHSQSNQAFLYLNTTNHGLNMTIYDQGVGFELDSIRIENQEHLGLKGMMERAENVNANFEIISAKNKGVKIIVSLSQT